VAWQVDYEPSAGRPFWERLMEDLVQELYLYDRGDGNMACVGPIYYFTGGDNPEVDSLK
jgi:hypothetical protein